MFEFQRHQPLSDFSTLGIGGPADYFIEVESIDMMQQLIVYCKTEGLPYLVIGKGSNILFHDRGFQGLVILNKIAFCNLEEASVSAGAGFSFSLLGVQTARKGKGGLEFASGIPGSVGGAVYMNAGANGREVADILKEVVYITHDGEKKIIPREEIQFSYRSSSFQNWKGAIVSAAFHLTLSLEARKKQLEIVEYRSRTQPYKDPSAGCVFRNPPSLSAGALIDRCGLKGRTIGGAQVSLVHANFIINTGAATSQDVLDLAQLILETVKEQTGVELEMEVRALPYRIN